MSKLGTLVSDFKKGATDVKDFLVKAGSEAPKIVADVLADESKIAPVVEQFIPGSAAVITLGNNLLDLVAQAVEDAGSAAGANGLSVTLDKTTVAAVQTVIAAAKAAAAKA